MTPAEPHILAPLNKVRDLGTASNTGWTAVMTLCIGAIVSALPLGWDALAQLFSDEPTMPIREGLYQMVILVAAIVGFAVSVVFVVPRLGQFNRQLRALEDGRRFHWNEATSETKPLPPAAPRHRNRLQRLFDRWIGFWR